MSMSREEQLKILGQMKDSDIDYSDIAATDAEFWQEATVRDFQKINYSFSRIIIILGVWEVGIDGCPLLPIL